MDLLEKYRKYIIMKLEYAKDEHEEKSGKPISVGIVGGGISGLYSALLLQHYIPNVNVKIFEANNRVGGRICTYKFSEEPYQYCEAGAMKIPCIPSQDPIFQLIEYLNKLAPTSPLKLIDYIYSCPSGNRILVNGTKMKDGRVMNTEYANTHCTELGFSHFADIGDMDEAGKLLESALEPVLLHFNNNFEDAMVKYNDMSLHQYLITEAGWTEERINYFEVMNSIRNKSYVGLIDLLFNNLILFSGASAWKTIEGGMSRLPELCTEVVCQRGGKILLNTKVESMVYTSQSSIVELGCRDLSKPASELTYESFDAVIVATPTSCIRMMKERPHWPDEMEHALHSLRHTPIIKIHLRFKSRFWECSNLQHPPSLGGASTTDLPIHRIVYPSHGIGDKGKGILMAYAFSDDALHWSSMTNTEKVQVMLKDLQALYPEVDIMNEYAGGSDRNSDIFLKEAHVADWTTQWCMGVVSSQFPGQFNYLYPILAQNRGNIYFAGDHLSTNLVFMAGALESTKFAVQQLIKRQVNEELLINHLEVKEIK